VKVTLAGVTHCPGTDTTPPSSPESITAAYARISRSPRAVSELRRRAARDIETARSFNRKIIFHLGHESVAEHAVFNIDILGISRLAVEALEHSRLASYTERSQRYVRIGSDYHIPAELRESGLSSDFAALCRSQHRRYERLVSTLKQTYSHQKAKEDARYALGLATTTQLGMTINSRSLGMMFSRLDNHELHECRSLSAKIRTVTGRIAPSLIRDRKDSIDRTDPIPDPGDSTGGESTPYPRLLWYTANPSDIIHSVLKYSSSSNPWSTSRGEHHQVPPYMVRGSNHPFPRALEAVQFGFELCISASCFAQLKRHRMATIISQQYDPSLECTIPPTVVESGYSDLLLEGATEAEDFMRRITAPVSSVRSYPLLNAHRRRVLFIINARSFCNMIHLRTDRHAQWDIRDQTMKMRDLVCSRLPELTKFLPLPS